MAIRFDIEQKKLEIILEGDVLHYDNAAQKKALLQAVQAAECVVFAAQNLGQWDSGLTALLYQVALAAEQAQVPVAWNGLPKNLQQLLKLALAVDRKPVLAQAEKRGCLERIGAWGVALYGCLREVGAFLADVGSSITRLLVGRSVMRRIDLEFALEDCGYKAVGIVFLVSFMVGLILAFVGALQLKMFGAQIYVASLVVIGMTRIMGAIMTGVIMAGRTGAAYAATIGSMQVNEETDALKTMGLSVTDFLVLPRLFSLVVSMPLLTIWADFSGILGGAFVAVVMMDISLSQYWQYSVNAFGLTNFVIGVLHGMVYGIIIAFCGCYQGMQCGRNAESVGLATTRAVVSSIVIMIVATGLLTLVFEVIGI
jgi:phospholipid/cholesterol/gamma-HCH transport system permease protein